MLKQSGHLLAAAGGGGGAGNSEICCANGGPGGGEVAVDGESPSFDTAALLMAAIGADETCDGGWCSAGGSQASDPGFPYVYSVCMA